MLKNDFIDHVDIVFGTEEGCQDMSVLNHNTFKKVIYTSNNNIDKRNGYTIQWICISIIYLF